MEIIQSRPCAQAGSARAGCPGPLPFISSLRQACPSRARALPAAGLAPSSALLATRGAAPAPAGAHQQQVLNTLQMKASGNFSRKPAPVLGYPCSKIFSSVRMEFNRFFFFLFLFNVSCPVDAGAQRWAQGGTETLYGTEGKSFACSRYWNVKCVDWICTADNTKGV